MFAEKKKKKINKYMKFNEYINKNIIGAVF